MIGRSDGFNARVSRARWVEKSVERRDPPRVYDGNVQSGDPARFVRRAGCPGEPPTILHGVNAADLRKLMVRELRLEGGNRIVQRSMADMLPCGSQKRQSRSNIASIAVVRRAGSRSPKIS
jgi:hypothetical protein